MVTTHAVAKTTDRFDRDGDMLTSWIRSVNTVQRRCVPRRDTYTTPVAESPGSGSPRCWTWWGWPAVPTKAGAKATVGATIYRGSSQPPNPVPGWPTSMVCPMNQEAGWLETYLTTRVIAQRDRRYTIVTQEHPNTAQHEIYSRSSADCRRLGFGELRVEPKIATDRWSIEGGPIVRARPSPPSSN